MLDMYCFLAGMANLCVPWILLILWRRRTGARLLPAPAAFLICFPVFFIGASIRSGFSRGDIYSYYIQQGLLFGILEEGAKYIAMRCIVTSCDSRRDAVSYGIGHSSYESFGAGLSCLGLIGTGRAASDIFLGNLWGVTTGAVICSAMTVIIFYGINTNRAKVILPAVMLVHAFLNASGGLFGFSRPIVILTDIIAGAGICFAAYRCWRAMEPPLCDTE